MVRGRLPRGLRVLALVLGLLVCGIAGRFGYEVWTALHPPVERLPLPADLVALDSDEGQALLDRAEARADLEVLLATFEPQAWKHGAGVAAVVAVEGARAGARVPQAAFFTPATEAVRPWWRILFTGMTLDDVGAMFEARGLPATVHHADEGRDAFRAALAANLSTPGDFLVANYARAPLGQGRTGNVAPVAAWDRASDRVLVLDGAAFRWPPVWVPVDTLFAAMDTVDTEVDRRRGWVSVPSARP